MGNIVGVLSNTALRKASSDTNAKAQTMEHKTQVTHYLQSGVMPHENFLQCQRSHQ